MSDDVFPAIRVPGATPEERAARLAGAFAEMAVSELILTSPGQAAITLRARETDLPRIILTASAGTILSTSDHSMIATIGPNELLVRGCRLPLGD